MPYISFKTNHKLTLRQENTIKSKSGELISLIPGKTEKALMIHMEDDQIMYFKGPSLEVITIFFRTTFKPFLSICRFYRLFLYF